MQKQIKTLLTLFIVLLLALSMTACSETTPLPDEEVPPVEEPSDPSDPSGPSDPSDPSDPSTPQEDITATFSISDKDYMSVSISAFTADTGSTARALEDGESIRTLTYTDIAHPEVYQPMVFNLSDGRLAILEISDAKSLGDGFILADADEIIIINQEPEVIEKSVADPISGEVYTKEEVGPLDVVESRYINLQLMIDLNTCDVYTLYGYNSAGENVGISNSSVNISGSIAADDSIILLLSNGTMYRIAKQNPTLSVALNNPAVDRIYGITDYISGYVIANDKLFDITGAKSPKIIPETITATTQITITNGAVSTTKTFKFTIDRFNLIDGSIKVDGKYYYAMPISLRAIDEEPNTTFPDYYLYYYNPVFSDGVITLDNSDGSTNIINGISNLNDVFFYSSYNNMISLIEVDFSSGEPLPCVCDIVQVTEETNSDNDLSIYAINNSFYGIRTTTDQQYAIRLDVVKDSGSAKLETVFDIPYSNDVAGTIGSLLYSSDSNADSNGDYLYQIVPKDYNIYRFSLEDGTFEKHSDPAIATDDISFTNDYLVYNRYLSGSEYGTFMLDLNNFETDIPFMISSSDIENETLTVFDINSFI